MLHSLPKSEISLLDLSRLPRGGIKGKDLSPWIESEAYEVELESNRAYPQRDGFLVLRLSPGELMVLPDPHDPAAVSTTGTSEAGYKCYPVRRQDSHYWFAATGIRSPEVFAKLCGVNLAPDAFANHNIAQTSVARTSAIIMRHDIDDLLCYYLLGDSSTALYMWECLVDAMIEFDGQTVSHSND
jgi:sarcosine oxidase subunit gamma